MTTHQIEIEGLPEGWKPVAYRIPMHNEFTLDDNNNPISTMAISFPCLIVEKIQPRRIVLEETEEIRTARPDEYYEHTNGITINNSHTDTSGEYRIWREVKEGE